MLSPYVGAFVLVDAFAARVAGCAWRPRYSGFDAAHSAPLPGRNPARLSRQYRSALSAG